MALEVEGVVDGSMGREEFLRGAGALLKALATFTIPPHLLSVQKNE